MGQAKSSADGSENTIVRLHRKARYTNIANSLVSDPRMTWQATGMMAYLLSLPDDWRINSKDLTNRKANGRDATRSVMRELERLGYMLRSKGQMPDGKWYTILSIFEEPIDTDAWNPGAGLSGVGLSGALPTTEKPTTNNQTSLRDVTPKASGTRKGSDSTMARHGTPPEGSARQMRDEVEKESTERTGAALRQARRKEALAKSRSKKDLPLEDHVAVSNTEPAIKRKKRPPNHAYAAAHIFKAGADRQHEWCARLVDSTLYLDSRNAGEGGPSHTDVRMVITQLTNWREKTGCLPERFRDLAEHFWVMVDQGEIKVTTAIRNGVEPWRVFVKNLSRVDSSLAKQEGIMSQLGGGDAVRDKLRERFG